MTALKKAVNWLHLFFVTIAKIMLVFMTLLISVQVFCRYVLDFSIMWSEEVALLLMVWFGFISLAIGVSKKLHISIELFTNNLPEVVQKIVFKFCDVAILFFGVVMVIYGNKLMQTTMSSTLPATGLPSGITYAVIPIAGILVVYHSLMDLLGFDQFDGEMGEQLMKGEEEDA